MCWEKKSSKKSQKDQNYQTFVLMNVCKPLFANVFSVSLHT